MCGILGYVSNKASSERAWLSSGIELLKLRGPDDHGFAFCDPATNKVAFTRNIENIEPSVIGFGHRRLAILDLSDRGVQPMICDKTGSMICYNGEVYNYIEIRQELIDLGYSFLGDTDTEVVFTALMHFGCSVVSRFQGMFAIAWYDAASQCLHLIRDPFAIKPFYYAICDGVLVFSSQQNVILSHPKCKPRLNNQAFYNYIRFGVNDDALSTLYDGIKQVPPGSVVSMHIKRPDLLTTNSYWRPPFGMRSSISFNTACNEMRDIFMESVAMHLRSDVPIAATLSGGIDSSAIVCAMRKINPKLEINTFSYAPRGQKYDESHFAKLVADKVCAQQHYIDWPHSDFLDNLDAMIDTQEDPFGGFSHYASKRLFESARHLGFKVVLSGQGGDELLAGYPIYFGVKVALAIRNGDWGKVIQWLTNWRDVGGGHFSGILMAAEHLMPDKYQSIARSLIGKPVWPKYLRESSLCAQVVKGRLELPLGVNGLQGYLYDSLTRTCLPNLLHYDDRNSMSQSQESRVPFLVTKLADYALSLPEEFLIGNDGVTKKVFRESMRGIVPDVILDRKDKVGFHTPREEFLLANSAWVDKTLLQARFSWDSVFDFSWIEAYWLGLQRGAKMKTMDFWRILCFFRWAEMRGIKPF